MPTYDYRCRKCGHVFELFHGMKDEKPKRCPRCKGRAQRLISGGVGILFKGSGFYITDHRSAHYRERAKQEKASGSGKSESGGGSGDSGSGKSESGGGSGEGGGSGAKADPAPPSRSKKKDGDKA